MTEHRGLTDLDLATTKPKGIRSSRAPSVNARGQTNHHAGRGPIFVNSSFRTSSTWLWQKLRSAPNVTAYYEIFHEALISLGRRDARVLSASSWASNHPHSAPYFLEYLPLLKEGGGLPTFDASMTYDRFIPAGGLEGQLSLEEIVHIDSLLRVAHANGKIPVLACTRTLGRASALSRTYGGTSILLVRNLFHQWASYCSQAADGNPYFLNTIGKTLAASRHDPFVRDLDDWFGSRHDSARDLGLFCSFLILHLYLYSDVVDYSDIVIDSTRIARDIYYRQEIEHSLSKVIGFDVDLSDSKEMFGVSFLDVVHRNEFLDTIDQFVKLIKGRCSSDESANFVQKMKDDALLEWDRHDFYARGAHIFHGRELESSKLERMALSDQFSRESDEMRGQIALLDTSNKTILSELEDVSRVFKDVDEQLAVARRELEAVTEQLIARSEELVCARASLAESGALQQILSDAVDERDSLKKRFSECLAELSDKKIVYEERSALQQSLNELTMERDDLKARFSECCMELESVRSSLEESAALRHQISSLHADRDGLSAQMSDLSTKWTEQRLELELALETALAEGSRLAEEKSNLSERLEEVIREREAARAPQARGLLQSAWARLDGALRSTKT